MPEAQELNDAYMDLGGLEERFRAKAKSPAYTPQKLGGLIALGAGMADATQKLIHGGPATALVGAAAPTVLDSVAGRTALASGLYHGGRFLSAAGRGASDLFHRTSVVPEFSEDGFEP